ncbi:hypothetical protein PIB30_021029 [Stylosanthes scabra]|uniref:Retrotransposon Copia-like N-terminal domain-containing protein n=1 Tax=Stylosanthes scabra TaxID=79078 RepID=A0ABU6VB23_9FABA|nr:hypothetical protein [Stylosanthes scabra]
MALITTQSRLKNALVPLTDKFEEDNFSSWQKLILLTIRTLKLESHLDPAKTPIQFEEIQSPEVQDAQSASKSSVEGEADKTAQPKKISSSSPKILQESEKFVEWPLIDSALMTWLDASMSLTYKNKSLNTQLRSTKKTGTVDEYLQTIRKLVDSLHSIGHTFSEDDHI